MRLSFSCISYETLTSTNDELLSRAQRGAEEGLVVIADAQSGGKGRLGRSWDSPFGGAYFSFLLYPPCTPSAFGSLSLVTALAVRGALEAKGFPTSIKWPNDVFLDGGKLAGISLLSKTDASSQPFVIIGVGINMFCPEDPQNLYKRAAYLQDGSGVGKSDAPVDQKREKRAFIKHIIDGVLGAFAVEYEEWLPGCRLTQTQIEKYTASLSIMGEDVTVRSGEGAHLAEGCVLGVDEQGALLLEDPTQGVRSVMAGEVTLRSGGEAG